MTDRLEITELVDKFVICRTIGHSWDDYPNGETDSGLFKSSRGALVLRCVRCRTERYDYIGNDMTVVYRYYKYPDNYTTIPGEATRPNLRAEMFRRSLLMRRRNGKI